MCPAICRVVTGQRLAGNDVTYVRTGASRSSAPASTRWATAAAVKGLDTLPTRNFVDGVTFTSCVRSENPNPSDHRTSDPLPTAADMPGMASAAMSESISARADAIASA